MSSITSSDARLLDDLCMLFNVQQCSASQVACCAQVVRRQGSQDEAIALLQQWLDIMDESGLSITAGMLDTLTKIMLSPIMQSPCGPVVR